METLKIIRNGEKVTPTFSHAPRTLNLPRIEPMEPVIPFAGQTTWFAGKLII